MPRWVSKRLSELVSLPSKPCLPPFPLDSYGQSLGCRGWGCAQDSQADCPAHPLPDLAGTLHLLADHLLQAVCPSLGQHLVSRLSADSVSEGVLLLLPEAVPMFAF